MVPSPKLLLTFPGPIGSVVSENLGIYRQRSCYFDIRIKKMVSKNILTLNKLTIPEGACSDGGEGFESTDTTNLSDYTSYAFYIDLNFF